MSDLHKCFGIQDTGDKVIICACVSKDMYEALERHFRGIIVSEIGAFANDYHHHIDGRDVVIVEQLIAFLTPVEVEE